MLTGRRFGAREAENVNLWIAIREAPLFGHGFGYAYQPPFGPAGRFAATFGPYYAHNFYLWLLAKAGIIGLVGFAMFALVPIIRAVRTQSVEAKARQRTLPIAVCSSREPMAANLWKKSKMTWASNPMTRLE